MKKLKISYMKKDGELPEGFYAFKEPNMWYLVMSVRKAKNAPEEVYEAVREYLYKI